MCVFSLWLQVNTESTHRCIFRLLVHVKLFSHFWHEKGFSPVWILIWVFSLTLRVKLFPHWSNMNGFSPVWILMCIWSLASCMKLSSQCRHEKQTGERLFSSVISQVCVKPSFKWETLPIKISFTGESHSSLRARERFVGFYCCLWAAQIIFSSYEIMGFLMAFLIHFIPFLKFP